MREQQQVLQRQQLQRQLQLQQQEMHRQLQHGVEQPRVVLQRPTNPVVVEDIVKLEDEEEVPGSGGLISSLLKNK